MKDSAIKLGISFRHNDVHCCPTHSLTSTASSTLPFLPATVRILLFAACTPSPHRKHGTYSFNLGLTVKHLEQIGDAQHGAW